MQYNIATLSNGLRVIHLPSASPVVYCGYQIATGSRNESSAEEGLAHFCEHTTFKGTARRSAGAIINSLERVGGSVNAYTTKEETVYYAAVPLPYVSRAIDLLTDIVFHSVYPQREIDKEVEVICEEIESYNDSPSELIFDDFESQLFGRSPLAHNILGTAERVRSFTTADALRFTRRHYRPGNMVFFIYGGSSPSAEGEGTKAVRQQAFFNRLLQQLEHCFAKYPLSPSPAEDIPLPSPMLHESIVLPSSFNGEPAAAPSCSEEVEPGVTVRSLNTHQAHVMVGHRAYAMTDPRRLPLFLLNNILGGPGLNARLNLVLREQRGLVYTVESYLGSYCDTGVWATYFGCDHNAVDRCLRLVKRELARYVDKPLSERSLHAAKQQLKGQIGIASDNRENFALDFGRTFLRFNRGRDLARFCARIDAITPADIQRVAEEVLSPDHLSTLIYR